MQIGNKPKIPKELRGLQVLTVLVLILGIVGLAYKPLFLIVAALLFIAALIAWRLKVSLWWLALVAGTSFIVTFLLFLAAGKP